MAPSSIEKEIPIQEQQGKPKAAPDGLPAPRRSYAAATVIGAIGLTVLDASSVNVGLPAIAASLEASAAEIVWIANVYSLTVLTLLLPLSAAAERIGFTRMFVAGIVLFLLAACVAAASTNMAMLMLARIGQGIGAATVSCLFGGLVRNIYPAHLLARGISINAMVIGFAAVLGPVIGAAVLSVASWRWLFLMNLPVGLIAMLGVRYLPIPPTIRSRFDLPGAVLSMTTLGMFVVGLDSLAAAPGRAAALMLAAFVLGVCVVRRSRAQPAPLVPVDLLARPVIGFAVLASALMFAAQMGTAVALPFFFLHVLERQYLEIGVLLGGWPIGGALMAPVAARLSDRYSAALLCAIGAAVMGLAMTALLLTTAQTHSAWLLLWTAFAGVGFGFFQTPNNRAMLSAAPRERSGAAGGLQATTRVFGQSVGIAGVGVAFGLSDTVGPYLALGVAILCALLAVVVNVIRVRNDARRGCSVRIPQHRKSS